jgi:hypothetical protein
MGLVLSCLVAACAAVADTPPEPSKLESPRGDAGVAPIADGGSVQRDDARALTCVAGELRCEGRVPMTCIDRAFVAGAPCPFACEDGACAGECVPGTRRCGAGETTETCDATAHFVAGVACEHVCVAGECAGSCDAGERECREDGA